MSVTSHLTDADQEKCAGASSSSARAARRKLYYQVSGGCRGAPTSPPVAEACGGSSSSQPRATASAKSSAGTADPPSVEREPSTMSLACARVSATLSLRQSASSEPTAPCLLCLASEMITNIRSCPWLWSTVSTSTARSCAASAAPDAPAPSVEPAPECPPAPASPPPPGCASAEGLSRSWRMRPSCARKGEMIATSRTGTPRRSAHAASATATCASPSLVVLPPRAPNTRTESESQTTTGHSGESASLAHCHLPPASPASACSAPNGNCSLRRATCCEPHSSRPL
mmetsp:Transcript_25981/g.65960  ORF Transcript_25981/g.65960 Transcript_25981/m.65960 type:complete len:286 (+) Transcript_25981:49-906(+)